MEPRLNIITFGVRDLNKAVAFYRDGLGWPQSSASIGDFAIFRLPTGITIIKYFPVQPGTAAYSQGSGIFDS
jgi:catechol 2,3-dioxygenase-like lactoylglutathione lyase family enzyme